LSTDENAPARRGKQASREHHHEERVDPETLALQLVEHAADQQADTDIDVYLARVVAELLSAEPGVREHVSDLFFVELTEELSRSGEEGAVRAVLKIQTDWDKVDGR